MAYPNPGFVPDPQASHDEMTAEQREIAATATFADDCPFDPAAASLATDPGEAPVVVGVDQAFLEERAVSALVAMRGDEVVERAHAVSPLAVPYIPGLLAYREGGPILAGFDALGVEPDLAIFDGSGRIHHRQAGIATHVGVVLDLPAIGVAKSLLCGMPRADVDDRPEGWRTPVVADDEVEAPEGTVLGHAFQTRQWARTPAINPVYVSPGHRLATGTATDLVGRYCAGHKLPEPTRLADAHADTIKAEYE